MAQRVKNLPAMQETWVQPLDWEDTWRMEWLPTLIELPGEFMDRGAWQATVQGVAKSQTQLSDSLTSLTHSRITRGGFMSMYVKTNTVL